MLWAGVLEKSFPWRKPRGLDTYFQHQRVILGLASLPSFTAFLMVLQASKLSVLSSSCQTSRNCLLLQHKDQGHWIHVPFSSDFWVRSYVLIRNLLLVWGRGQHSWSRILPSLIPEQLLCRMLLLTPARGCPPDKRMTMTTLVLDQCPFMERGLRRLVLHLDD